MSNFIGIESELKQQSVDWTELSNGINGQSCICDQKTGSNARVDKSEKMSVKSRVSFFEDKKSANYPQTIRATIRLAKSMTNLASYKSMPGEQEAKLLPQDTLIFPKKNTVASSGCPFAGKRELKNVRLKNYVSSSQQNDTLHLKAMV